MDFWTFAVNEPNLNHPGHIFGIVIMWNYQFKEHDKEPIQIPEKPPHHQKSTAEVHRILVETYVENVLPETT